MSETMWMVRAGEGGYLFEKFKKKGIVALGFKEVKDISKIDSPERLREMIKRENEGVSGGLLAGFFVKFKFIMKKGDYVITYNPSERIYLVGRIESDYIYDPEILKEEGYSHIRKVKWLKKISRDNLSPSAKNSLGSALTLFELSENVKEEILSVLKHKKEKLTEDLESEKQELDALKEDIKVKAHEFLKDKILSLSWEEMEELIAGLLRAMGYKTMLTPKGADGGMDIFASPDGLGLEEPRIKVQVKHRSQKIGAPEISSFIGRIREKNVKALFVSTGGFTKDARKEAQSSSIPLMLIDLEMLANLISQYYDKFDEETKKLIPLVKIYWPI